MTQRRIFNFILSLTIVLVAYYAIFKLLWNFDIFNFSLWKMFFHYLSVGVTLSPAFIAVAFSFPFIFVTLYLLISGFSYRNNVVKPVEEKQFNQEIPNNTTAESFRPNMVNGIDVGFIPEYSAKPNYQTPETTRIERVEEIANEQDDALNISELLVKTGFEPLENPTIEGYTLSHFAIADRTVLFGGYFDNKNAIINENSNDENTPPSWLKNGQIIESPLYRLHVAKKIFINQAMEVLENVHVDFIGVFFLDKTPENLSDLTKKAEEYNIKIVCLDNLPNNIGKYLTGHEVKRNDDEYFKKFVQSVAHYLDPAFFYDNSDDDLEEEE